MAYCHEHAIPHSEFLEWDPEDRAKVMAFALEQSVRCSLCGTAPWEWEENRFAYTALDDFCQGCYQKSVFSDRESSSLPGTNVRLVPTTPQLTAQMAMKAKKRSRMKMD
jgi:hypothetical protein